MPGTSATLLGFEMAILTGMTCVTFWKLPDVLDCGNSENTPAAPPWISDTVPVMAGTMDGVLRVDGSPIDFAGGSAYPDHNRGFWEGVSWQWGQVQHDGLSFVYGRVRPPADAADPAHVPGFLAVLGPNGPLAFSTDATIDEANAPGADQPSRIVVRASGDGLDATLTLAIGQIATTHGRQGGVGGGVDFLQMRAAYAVQARVGERTVEFTAPGSAETFRGSRRLLRQ